MGKLSEIRELLADRPRLRPDIASDVTLVEKGKELQKRISGIISDYGKVRSPYYLLISSREEDGHLADIGYSLEYVVLLLTKMGIGTCWIGKGFREEQLTELIDLPDAQESRALIAFGRPESKDQLTRIDEPNRKGLDHFLLNKRRTQLDEEEKELLDGLRRAPSAINGQPWRVLIERGMIHLFIEILSKITRMVVKKMLTMNKIDGGIGLSHLEITGRNLWEEVALQRKSEIEMGGMEYVGSFSTSEERPIPLFPRSQLLVVFRLPGGSNP